LLEKLQIPLLKVVVTVTTVTYKVVILNRLVEWSMHLN